MTLTERIKAVRERLSRATPVTENGWLPELEPSRMAKISPSNEDFEFNISDEFTLEEDDAELIAAAPADLQLLCDCLELVIDQRDRWIWNYQLFAGAGENAAGEIAKANAEINRRCGGDE